MLQPKWYQWVVIWATFGLCFLATGGSDTRPLIPFIIAAGVLLIWMLHARAARS
jgi:hypothetical protein